MSDVSSVTNLLLTSNEGFTSTVGSTGITSGGSIVPLTNVSGLTNGSVFVGIVEPGLTNQQVFTGIVDTAGTQITSVKWTRGANTAHAAGVTVVDYSTGTAINMITKAIAAHANNDGTLKNNTVTTSVIADNAVTTSKIVDANVTTAKIADGAVTPVKFSNPYKFRVYRSTDKAISGSVWTNATFDTVDFDTNSNFDLASTHAYIVAVTGYYYINGQIGVSDAGISTGSMQGALYKNGSPLDYSTVMKASGDAGAILRARVGDLYHLTAGDTLDLYAFITEGGRAIQGGSQYTFMSGFLVSQT